MPPVDCVFSTVIVLPARLYTSLTSVTTSPSGEEYERVEVITSQSPSSNPLTFIVISADPANSTSRPSRLKTAVSES